MAHPEEAGHSEFISSWTTIRVIKGWHVYCQTGQGEGSLEVTWFCSLEAARGPGQLQVCVRSAPQEAKWGPPSPCVLVPQMSEVQTPGAEGRTAHSGSPATRAMVPAMGMAHSKSRNTLGPAARDSSGCGKLA